MRQTLKVQEIAEKIRVVLAEDAPSHNPGGVLSIRGLAERFDSSFSTVRRAVNLLKKEGLLSPQVGRGTFVRQEKAALVRRAEASTKSILKQDALPALPGPWALSGLPLKLEGSDCRASICRGVIEAAMEEVEPLMLIRHLRHPDQLIHMGVRGVLLVNAYFEKNQRQYAASMLPTVVLDDIPLVRGLDYAVADNRRGSELIAKELVRLGHRHIAFVRSNIRRSSDPTDLHPDSDSLERAGFLRTALRRRGLDLPDRWMLDLYGTRLRKREFSANQMMNMRPRPTVFVFSNELRARTTIRVLRQNGVSVPGQVSVVSFMSSKDIQEDLSGVEIDFEEMGRRGYQRLLERAQGKVPAGTPRRMLTPVSLHAGSTLGPVVQRSTGNRRSR